jgi:hypothetical protein
MVPFTAAVNGSQPKHEGCAKRDSGFWSPAKHPSGLERPQNLATETVAVAPAPAESSSISRLHSGTTMQPNLHDGLLHRPTGEEGRTTCQF